jgi:hypothetical protein
MMSATISPRRPHERADRDHVSELIDPEAEMRRNDDGCLLTGDDGGSVGDASRQQVLPSVNGGSHMPSAESRRRRAPGFRPACGVDLAPGERRLPRDARRRQTQVHGFCCPVRIRVAVQAGVLPVELLTIASREGHRDLVGLSDVADVDTSRHHRLRRAKAFAREVIDGAAHERLEQLVHDGL